MSKLKVLLKAWEKFWFSEVNPERIHIFRFFFGLILFGYYFTRSFDLQLFYSDAGLVRQSVMTDLVPMAFRVSILNYFSSYSLVLVCHIFFLISLLAMTFGIFAGVSTFLAFFLHLSFFYRDMAAAYGFDLIATFYLFYLCIAQIGMARGNRLPVFTSVALRLGQIQLCLIYGYSGLEKFKGTAWWRGEALWDVLINRQLARWDFSWMSHFPFLLIAGTYVTLLWETYFPILVWIRPIRIYVLILGVMLHFGIGVALSLPFFGAVMVSTYVLFLDDAVLKRIFPEKLKSFVELPKSLMSRLEDFGG